MQLKRPSALTVLTLALLVLLPTLALLQYRWVGQVNDAERERMQRNLRAAALQFRDGFDGEISRAVFSLRLDAATVRAETWERYADRFETWRDTAAHPAIVSAIYLIDAPNRMLRIRRWNAVDHSFEPTEWPARLNAWRPQIEREAEAFSTGQRFVLPPPSLPVDDDESLLIAPIVNAFPRPARRPAFEPLFGFTVLQLDIDRIRTDLLPALVQRHFSGHDGASYRVAVTTRGDAPRTIYQSDPAAPVDAARADATELIHGTFPGVQALLARRAGPPDRGERGGRGERARDGAGQPERRTNVIVEVFGAEGQAPTVRRFVNRESGRWQLLVQHPSGSLEAAVASVRRRNLAISFGTLILLTVSVVLLTTSSRRAQRLARQQVEFVASVSHELRTPVAVIRSAAENLAQGVVASPDRVKQYGGVIENEARRLGDMVERVLQYGGIEAGRGQIARAPVAPADVVTSAIDAAAPVVGATQIDRRVPDDLPPVIGDAGALRSAVQNLIVNAAKYGGESWVGITAERADGPHPAVRIIVEDRGPGIPPAELPHIFEPFYRGADAIAKQIQGSGLGLSIVRQIVQLHGGRVDAAPRPAGGMSFVITLPVESPAT